MCRKVVLTKTQAEEFESFKKLRNGLEEWARDKYDPNAPNSVIHNLTFDEVAHAYYIGYEIEPEQPKFQPGDKVICCDVLYKVFDVQNQLIIVGGGNVPLPLSQCRLASPKEIFWLEKLGRKIVADFKYRDVVRGKDDYIYEVSDNDRSDDHILQTTAEEWYSQGRLSGIYPAESFRKFPKEPE